MLLLLLLFVMTFSNVGIDAKSSLISFIYIFFGVNVIVVLYGVMIGCM